MQRRWIQQGNNKSYVVKANIAFVDQPYNGLGRGGARQKDDMSVYGLLSSIILKDIALKQMLMEPLRNEAYITLLIVLWDVECKEVAVFLFT